MDSTGNGGCKTSDIHLTVAAGDSDITRDFTSGEIRADGIDINYLKVEPPEVFHRFLKNGEFDVAELSMGMHASLVSQNDQNVVAIPVFPSRAFRLSSFYVRADGPVRRAEDLVGLRVGVPEWAQTATIYARGWLSDYVGIDLKSIYWFQAGVDAPGRAETVKLALPSGFKVTEVRDRTLSEMLLSGAIDAIISATPPEPYEQGDRRMVRMVSNTQAAEQKYWDDTGIFPIMHTVGIRRRVCDANPWVPASLLEAFTAAKDNSLRRALTMGKSMYPIPMHGYYALEAQRRLGKDFFPYDIEPNRVTLEAFLKFAREQGVCHRLLRPEELFASQVTR